LSQRQNKRTSSILIGVSIITVLVIVGFILATQNNVNWSSSYKPNDSQPYGTSVLKTLLEKLRQDQEFVFISDSTFEQLPTNPTGGVDNYIYVGEEFYADERDNDTLMKFLEAGNTVFISANNLNEDLIEKVLRRANKSDFEDYQKEQLEIQEQLKEESETAPAEDTEAIEYDENEYSEDVYIQDNLEYHYDETLFSIPTDVTLQDSIFLQTRDEKHDRTKLSYVYDFDTVPNEWQYFSEFNSLENGYVQSEGYFTKTRNKSSIQHTNFISISVGQGRLYLHLTPLALTNYSMINRTHMEHAREIFEHLGKGRVYWGEDNRIYSAKRNPENIDTDTPSEGPMEFILSEPALRSAWYTLLAGSILYMIFGVKRKQRIIPVAESMQNTSIEYAEVISQLFMEQADHKKLVDLKMDMFKSNLREKYNIKLPTKFDDENEEFFKHVSIKTGTPQELIQEIFFRYKSFTKNIIVETPEMLAFNRRIEEFYTTSR
jgi:hypothetical protein